VPTQRGEGEAAKKHVFVFSRWISQSKKEWYIIYVKLFFVVDVPVILMLISFEV
jgi:hypothetical protein